MRVLLDEQIDRRLKRHFAPEIEVRTVGERRWNGKKNGALLQLAQAEFDVLVTMDKNIVHQQNLSGMTMSLVILSALSNRYADMLPLMPQVNDILKTIQPGEIVYVTA